jgi:ketopantoate reductase
MVCVKLWDTEAALRQLRPLVGDDTMLVSFQNGVLKDSYLRAAFDPPHLIGGVAYVAARARQESALLLRRSRWRSMRLTRQKYDAALLSMNKRESDSGCGISARVRLLPMVIVRAPCRGLCCRDPKTGWVGPRWR